MPEPVVVGSERCRRTGNESVPQDRRLLFLAGSCAGETDVSFVTDAHRRMVGLAMRRQPIGCRAVACRADFGFRLVIPESRFAGWDAGRSGSVSALPWRRDSGCTQPERMERGRRLRPDALCRSGGSASPWEGMRTGTGVFVLSSRAVRVAAEHRMDGMRGPRRAVSEDGPSRGERNFRSPRDGSKRSVGALFRSVVLSLSAHDDEAPDYRAGAGFDVESLGEGGTGGPSSSARRACRASPSRLRARIVPSGPISTFDGMERMP